MLRDNKGIWSQDGTRFLRLAYRLVATWLAGSLPNRCLLCHQSMQAPESGICMDWWHSRPACTTAPFALDVVSQCSYKWITAVNA